MTLPANKELTTKQDGFAFDIASGIRPFEAYSNHYSVENMGEHSIYVEASRLQNVPAVALRIRYYKDEIAKKKILSAAEIAGRLSELAMADLADFVDDDGNIRNINKRIKGHQAVSSYSRYTGYNKDGLPYERKSIRLVSVIDALQELNRMQGNHAPSKSVNLNMNWDVEMVERPIPADRQADFTDEPE